MKLSIVLALMVTSTVAVSAGAAEPAELKAEAKQAMMALAKNLSGELKTAMKSGGPGAAIEVCNTKALPITAQISEQQGWQIGRTSLKLRNAENKPDAWELKVLQQFADQAAQGANLKTLAYSEVVDVGGQQQFRMMKAIPVQDKCLACHGSDIAAPVAAKLQQLYPQDQATGFKAGDLRGAFSLKKML
ncbi:Tll0287-like domain-containing protein [Marinobacterium jannaschii]|uniref:Tll0287-like domain-containing protein n=1 Tax=Marinobacterium jannaschii TaxID=64970 RepID=UPI000486330D|nr:DUF3365 domain-containing protein [Marinobacterium jannaschii]